MQWAARTGLETVTRGGAYTALLSDHGPEAALGRPRRGSCPSARWFVLNARERAGSARGEQRLPTGWTGSKAGRTPATRGQLVVLGPGEPIGMYHWEADQEDFLVLSGEALLLVEARNGRCGSGTSCTVPRRRST